MACIIRVAILCHFAVALTVCTCLGNIALNAARNHHHCETQLNLPPSKHFKVFCCQLPWQSPPGLPFLIFHVPFIGVLCLELLPPASLLWLNQDLCPPSPSLIYIRMQPSFLPLACLGRQSKALK